MANFTKPLIMPALATSAKAAALQCSGGANGRMCGLSWRLGAKWDGSQGAGQQMAAMEIVLSNMIDAVKPPLTSSSGGTSEGNPAAGIGVYGKTPPVPGVLVPPTAGAKAGAAILTILAFLWAGSLWYWMCAPIGEGMSAEEREVNEKGKEKEVVAENASAEGESSSKASTVGKRNTRFGDTTVIEISAID